MSNLNLITCIVQRGIKDKIVEAAMSSGATGATYYYGRGTGVRETLKIANLIRPEKEIILIVVKEEEIDEVFDAIVKAGKLNKKGFGLAYVHKLDRVVGFQEDLFCS